jgi:hypothetical protein
MNDSIHLESGHVLFADLPKDKEDIVAFEKLIKATIDFYRKVYGVPRRVWVKPSDVPESIKIIDGLKIERRGGCPRGKVLVM